MGERGKEETKRVGGGEKERKSVRKEESGGVGRARPSRDP